MDKQENKLGFTAFAENWNGRLAMLPTKASLLN